MSANPLRGEVGLRLGGRETVLRPTFGALVSAEAEVGSLFQLMDRAGAGEVQFSDMAALMWHCRTSEQEDRETFEQHLLAEGLLRLMGPYRELLLAVFDGGN